MIDYDTRTIAIDIIADIRGRTFAEAMDLVQDRIDKLKAACMLTGISIAREAIQEAFSGKALAATLQAEHQADHDEEREHGWAVPS